MNLVPDKKDFKKISPDVAGAYPRRLVERGYQLVSTVRATEKSHFDVYGLVKSGKKVKVVYDVKAQMLSVTAFDDFIGEVCSILDAVRGGVKAAVEHKASQGSFDAEQDKGSQKNNKQKGGENSANVPRENKQPKPEQKQSPKPEQKQQPKLEQKQSPKPEQKQQPKPEQKQQPKPEQKQQPKPEQKQQSKPEQNNGSANAHKSKQKNNSKSAKPEQKPNSTNAQKPNSSVEQNSVQNVENGAKKTEQKANAEKKEHSKQKQGANEKKPAVKKEVKPVKANQKPKPEEKQGAIMYESVKAEQKKSVVETEKAEELPKSDFTLKKYTAERFDSVLDEIKALKIKVKQKQARGKNNGEMVRIYELSEGLKKLTVCFMADKGILQIQGKPCDFLSKIQTVFSESGDFKSAIGAHIEQKQTQNKASDVERQLKKYLPTGILYLSPQAKIDFSIGVIDLLVSDATLSDYSSLLIPPYRGLEMLIFDLQKAQGIKVKMIGQAFEKTPSGEYTLKASYRRRIGSVIFNEVMTALYVEYNSTRNFYVHSSLGQQTKVISDRNQARAIYERMLAVVEYNAKKLKEIHFSI